MASFSLLKKALNRARRPLPVRRFIQTEGSHLVYLLLGTFLSAAANVLFMIPHNLAAGGLGGLSIIIHHFTGWPVGLMFWIMNIPLVTLGFFYLGRWHFVLRTLVAITLFSFFVDLQSALAPRLFPVFPITDDILLSALCAAVIGGLGSGLIYSAGSSLGSTGVVTRIIQLRTGRPLSLVYFYVDGVIILITALVFGWETALYAFALLYAWGATTDYFMDGPSRTLTAMIVTARPEAMLTALLTQMNRGATHWQVTGAYTGEQRTMISCTILRPERSTLLKIARETDQDAFVSIGVGHQAVGHGFTTARA